MPDFEKGTIELRYKTDSWGPFSFDFDDLIPTDETLSDVTIRAFVGNVKSDSDLSLFTEVTSDIIEGAEQKIVNDRDILFKMQYPQDAARVTALKGSKVTLVFEVTLAGGGTHPFYYQYVKIC